VTFGLHPSGCRSVATSVLSHVKITGPNDITYLVQSLGTLTSANIVSMMLTGAKSAGAYVVVLLDEMGQVLATGQFEILKA